MLQNAYFLAKIGADTAENEQHFAEILPIGLPAARRAPRPRRAPAAGSFGSAVPVHVEIGHELLGVAGQGAPGGEVPGSFGGAPQPPPVSGREDGRPSIGGGEAVPSPLCFF